MKDLHNLKELSALRDASGRGQFDELFARVTEARVELYGSTRGRAVQLIRRRADEPVGEFTRPTAGKHAWVEYDPRRSLIRWRDAIGTFDEQPVASASASPVVVNTEVLTVTSKKVLDALATRTDAPILTSAIDLVPQRHAPVLRMRFGTIDGDVHGAIVAAQMTLPEARPAAQQEAMKELIKQLRAKHKDGVTYTVDGPVVTIHGYGSQDVRIYTDHTGEQWVGGLPYLNREPKWK